MVVWILVLDNPGNYVTLINCLTEKLKYLHLSTPYASIPLAENAMVFSRGETMAAAGTICDAIFAFQSYQFHK
jgi:hypothetical protein